ncbi:MAG: hypothetical protein RR922_07000 [Clostridia bacterium]
MKDMKYILRNALVLLILTVIVVGLSICIAFYFKYLMQPVHIKADTKFKEEDLEGFIGFEDYVFVGTVKEHLGNFNDNSEIGIPYNKFKVTVDKNIKGNLKKDIEVLDLGGTTGIGAPVIIEGKEPGKQLEVGKTYLLLGSVIHDKSIVIEMPKSKIELLNYSVDANTDEINNLIKTYEEAYKNERKYERRRNKSKYDETKEEIKK